MIPPNVLVPQNSLPLDPAPPIIAWLSTDQKRASQYKPNLPGGAWMPVLQVLEAEALPDNEI